VLPYGRTMGHNRERNHQSQRSGSVIEMQGKSIILNKGAQGLPSKVPQEMYRVIGNAPAGPMHNTLKTGAAYRSSSPRRMYGLWPSVIRLGGG